MSVIGKYIVTKGSSIIYDGIDRQEAELKYMTAVEVVDLAGYGFAEMLFIHDNGKYERLNRYSIEPDESEEN